MNSKLNKKTYEVIRHEKMLWDDHCKAYPSQKLFEENGVYVNKSFIPYCYETTKIVFFVSGTNGDEFGQYETAEAAINKAKEMAQYPEKLRRQFDV